MNTNAFHIVVFSLAIGCLCRASDDSPAAEAAERATRAVSAIPGLDKPEEPSSPTYDEEKATADMKAREALWRKQKPQWTTIPKKFYDLQSKRAAILTASDKVKKSHVKALRALYDQVMALKEQLEKVGSGEDDWEITINTELRIFGAGMPDVFYWHDNDNERVEPKMLVDPRTHITYKLKSDGRHITAIAPNGKILWSHDAFKDYGLAPYRFTKPVITVFKLSAGSQAEVDAARERQSREAITFDDGRALGFERREDYTKRFIEITFNSSQFGDIDAATGKFTFGGQN